MILAVLQARTSSSRLPGKVLLPILGQPMLMMQIERIRRSVLIDRLVVATSINHSDDAIESLCHYMGIDCFRGALEDVLDRFHQAVSLYCPETVVRLTGDCPLIDPEIVDRTILHHLHGNFDYTTNSLKPTLPDGLDVEIFTPACLEDAWREALLPSEREHVTPFIYCRPDRYCIGSYEQLPDLSKLRWTVDKAEDFAVVSRIYEALYPMNPRFGMADILDFMQAHPEIAALNAGNFRHEGYARSLAQDEEYLQNAGITQNK